MLDEHITSLAKSNLSWIKHNPEALESLISLHQQYDYETKDMLDLDASLYEAGFFKTDETNIMKTFHNKNITDKAEYINNLDNNRVKELGIRIIGRNYFDNLPEETNYAYNSYLNEVFYLVLKKQCKGLIIDFHFFFDFQNVL